MDRENLVAVIIFMLIIAGLFVVSRTGQQIEQQRASETAVVSPTTTVSVLQSAYVFNPQATDTRTQLSNGRADLSLNSDYAGFANLGTKAVSIGSAIVTTTNFNYGGSGVFVYLTPYESEQSGWQMSDAQSLGDRVKVDSVTAEGDMVKVVYFDYGPTQSMADTPNVRVEKTFSYKEGKLIPQN